MCEGFQMLQNPGGIVNAIFTSLFGTHTHTHTHFHISNSFNVHVWPLPPLRASVHAVQIAVIGDVFVFRLRS